MNKIKLIIVVISICIIIIGIMFGRSNKEESQIEGKRVSFENYVKRHYAGKEKLEFYDTLEESSRKESCDGLQKFKIYIHTLEPEDSIEAYYDLGECFQIVNIDIDSDKIHEKICLRYLQYKEFDDACIYGSLLVDVFKNKKQVLRQELDRGFFFEERFVGFKDIDLDEKVELITKVRFSPDCSGCSSYRIYTFKDDRFELTLNLFKIDPENPAITNVMSKLSCFEEMIQKDYRGKTKTEYPCGYWESCIISDPWLVDSDHDALPEVVLLSKLPYDSACDEDKTHYLLIAKFAKSGKLKNYNLYPIKLGYCDAFVDVLGFLETNDKNIHLLVNWASGATSTAYPLLNIFNVQWNNVKKIGEFCGFYEHVIAERLRDLDGDGKKNTEIIYVKDSYIPPGAAAADVVLTYGIAEYRDGRYVDANEKFSRFLHQINQYK